MSESQNTLEGWVIVELFGHKRMAGYLRSQAIPGGTLPCLDVPATEPTPCERSGAPHTPAYSKILGLASIYGIVPVTEDLARRAAREIERWSSPIPIALPLALPPANAAVDDDDIWPDPADDAGDADDAGAALTWEG